MAGKNIHVVPTDNGWAIEAEGSAEGRKAYASQYEAIAAELAPVQAQLLRDVFGVEPPAQDWKPETWADYAAPIVRTDGDGRRKSVLATFGLTPIS
ncbi:hypothetical protein AU476_04465 [Cupriavidus sp. UYMSc13B]|nr:hypothetical protein AU476_04465 [Cupriavidus sp. UYMSc13B]